MKSDLDEGVLGELDSHMRDLPTQENVDSDG